MGLDFWRQSKPDPIWGKVPRRADDSRGVGPILAVVGVVLVILWVWSRFQ